MKKYFMLMAILTVGTMALAEKEVKLDETVITIENFETSVQETPKNITVITSEEISNKGANSVAEALKGVPGLVVRYMDGGEPSFDLRGYGATAGDNTLVLIDGIPLNSVQGSGYSTNQIPVDMIDKIEVIPFGGAVMYGDSATGGVVNIITKSPQNRENYGSLGLEVGSWGTTKGNFNYGTKITDRFLMNIAYSNYRSDGYRDINDDKFDKADKKESIWLRGKYLLNNGNLEFNYRQSDNEDYYSGYLEKNDFDSDTSLGGAYPGVIEMNEKSYSLKYNQKISESMNFLIYGGYDESDYSGSSSNYLASQYYIKPQIKYNYGENSYIILGGDYKDGKSEDRFNIPRDKDKTRESYAGYILNKTIVGKWQFTQGYRREKIKYEYNKKDYTNYPEVKTSYHEKEHGADSYELAVNYLYSDTGNIYLSYVNGYRSPSIQDMGAWYGDIKLQKNESYELGIKDTIGNTYVSSSLFFMTTDDEIFYDKADNLNKTNKNFDGEVERKGVQLAISHYFDKLILRENISYIKADVETGKYEGNKFPGVPEWTFNLGATYNFTDKFLGNIDMYYQSKIFAQDDFGNKLGEENEYLTIDTNIKYQFNEGLELYAGIKNLFDEKYANTMTCSSDFSKKVYYPADGRSYYTGFKYSF